MPHVDSSVAVLPDLFRPLILDDQCRFGSANDGGYVMPRRLLESSRTMLSCGINLDWSFERDVLRDFPGLTILSFDATTHLRRCAWWAVTRFCWSSISRKPEHFRALAKPFSYIAYYRHPRVRHIAKFVGNRDSVDTMAISHILDSPTIRKPVVVKMDIEGTEYDILGDVLARSDLVTGMAIEFHDVSRRYEQLCSLIKTLQTRYFISHIHINNAVPNSASGLPRLVEVSFIRHDLVTRPVFFHDHEYRLEIDAPNVPSLPDATIRFGRIA